MKNILLICFLLFAYKSQIFGQSRSDKIYIRLSLIQYKKGNFEKSKQFLEKVKTPPKEIINKEVLFKYMYSEEYNNSFRLYLENYTLDTEMDSLLQGLNQITDLISLWDNEAISKGKLSKKYSIHNSSMNNVKAHIDSLINIKINIEISERIRDSLYLDSLDLVLFNSLKAMHEGNVMERVQERLNQDILEKRFGGMFASNVEYSFTQEFDGENMSYIFDVSYGGNYFTPGTYVNDSVNFIISETIGFIRADLDFSINDKRYAKWVNVSFTGTADATLPRTNRYIKKAIEWGDISGRAMVEGSMTDFNISKNQLISNLEIAYLRAYNMGKLFKDGHFKVGGSYNAIDYWTEDREKKGEKYRSASYIFIVYNFHESYFEDLSTNRQKELLDFVDHNPKKHKVEYRGMSTTHE